MCFYRPGRGNLVRGACIVQDSGRAFGRCGSGAVMGSKNLKALVARGTGSIRVAAPGKVHGEYPCVQEYV